jgi:hypothetical protein
MIHRRIPVWHLIVFATLSVCDLIATTWLLNSNAETIYESNPVAGWWLRQFGWPGLASFKAIAVFAVIGLASVIYRYRPDTARGVLTFGSATVLCVVFYSAGLAGYVCASSESRDLAELRAMETSNQRLDHALMDAGEFLRAKRDITSQVLAGSRDPVEAVQQLAAHYQARDPYWMESLRRQHPGLSDDQCIAVNFLTFSRGLSEDTPAAAARCRKVHAEIREVFDVSIGPATLTKARGHE